MGVIFWLSAFSYQLSAFGRGAASLAVLLTAES
jgi:hypothetical protein